MEQDQGHTHKVESVEFVPIEEAVQRAMNRLEKELYQTRLRNSTEQKF